jgi:hypothetical protein
LKGIPGRFRASECSREETPEGDSAFAGVVLRTAYCAMSPICRWTDLSFIVAFGTPGSDRFATAARIENASGIRFRPGKTQHFLVFTI